MRASKSAIIRILYAMLIALGVRAKRQHKDGGPSGGYLSSWLARHAAYVIERKLGV